MFPNAQQEAALLRQQRASSVPIQPLIGPLVISLCLILRLPLFQLRSQSSGSGRQILS